MAKLSHSQKTFQEELASILADCQAELDCAVREYEQDVQKAMEELEEGIQAHTRLAS